MRQEKQNSANRLRRYLWFLNGIDRRHIDPFSDSVLEDVHGLTCLRVLGEGVVDIDDAPVIKEMRIRLEFGG